jgi:hypothetical protein
MPTKLFAGATVSLLCISSLLPCRSAEQNTKAAPKSNAKVDSSANSFARTPANLFSAAAFESLATVAALSKEWQVSAQTKSVSLQNDRVAGRHISLSNQNPAEAVFLVGRLRLRPDWQHLTVRSKLSGKNLKRGTGEYINSGILLRFLDAQGAPMAPYAGTLALAKDAGWQSVTKKITVPPGAKFLTISPGLFSYTGNLKIDDIVVTITERAEREMTAGSQLSAPNPPSIRTTPSSPSVAGGNGVTIDSSIKNNSNPRSSFGKRGGSSFGAPSAYRPSLSPSQSRLPAPAEIVARLKPAHPRLIATEADFLSLKARVHDWPQAKQWYEALHKEAEATIGQAPSRYMIPDGLRLLAVSKQVLRRVSTLAMLYRLSGEARYASRAWQELEAATRFPDWNPRHFLDTAEMLHAFAIGYDWLYDAWTPQQRQTLRVAMLDKGMKPALECYRGRSPSSWWVHDTANWNQVCNGGVGIAALAIGDEAPEEAGELLHAILWSLPPSLRSLGPDGGTTEGPSYWDYGLSYATIFLASLQSATGGDFNLSQTPGLATAGYFPVYLKGPTGSAFNFSDGSEPAWGIPGMFWLAKRYGHKAFAAHRFQYLLSPIGRPSALDLLWGSQFLNESLAVGNKMARTTPPGDIGEVSGALRQGNEGQENGTQGTGRPATTPRTTKNATEDNDGETPSRVPSLAPAQEGGSPFAALAATPSLPIGAYFRETEVFTWRSAWNDPNALFFGLRAGDNTGSHSQLDAGNFVFEALGQRWAIDLGREDYNLPEYFGKLRPTYYRVRAEGHNTLVLNPGDKADQTPSITRIIRHSGAVLPGIDLVSGSKVLTKKVLTKVPLNGGSVALTPFAIADLTPAYAASATRVQRGLKFQEPGQLVVQDEIQTLGALDAWWFMHTRAQIELSQDKRVALLRQGGKELLVQIVAPQGGEFQVMKAEPLPSSPHPERQNLNTGISKLAIHRPAVREERITVVMTPLGDTKSLPAGVRASSPIPVIVTALDQWGLMETVKGVTP